MFRFLTVLLLFFCSDAVFAQAIQTPQNLNSIVQVAEKTFPRDINRLEDKFFNQTFKEETDSDRLNRLEYRVFGAIQQGSPQERVQRLKKASLNYRSQRAMALENEFYPQVQPTFTTKGGWKGVLGGLNNYFNGVPTGMTPQIYYPPSANHFYPNSYRTPANVYKNSPNRNIFSNGYEEYYKNNRGEWYYDNRNTGATTGVTILD